MSIKEISAKLRENSELYSDVFSVCQNILKYNSEATETREYLLSRVSSFNESGFSFGYFPKNEDLNILINIFGYNRLEELGLVYKKRINDNSHIREIVCGTLANHNLIMQYNNCQGDIIGYVGRTLLSKEDQTRLHISKYKNTEIKKSLNLFGLDKAKRNIVEKKHVIVVEGQFDCITCHKYGFNNTIALGGIGFTKYHYYLLSRYTKNFYIATDSDAAGDAIADKISYRYSERANVIRVRVPEKYKDLDQMLRTEGRCELLEF